jgi:hypothetical protein
MLKTTVLAAVIAVAVSAADYRVLAPTAQDNLTVFPIVSDTAHKTDIFLTLDEGIRSGQVVVTEMGNGGLVRPRRHAVTFPDPWPGPGSPMPIPGAPPPPPQSSGAEVNRLMLVNNSDRPLILLAGEIVTGGKQDRIVGRDRIVAPHSDPIDLSVFCVEPHRWVAQSEKFGAAQAMMAQPSVRQKAMAAKDQHQVWDEVARSRAAVVAAAPPAAAGALAGTSSYAQTMQNSTVAQRVDVVAAPVERSWEKAIGELRAHKAVGAVVAVNGEIVWADIFASPALLEKYWPKLVRSYAADAVSSRGYNKPASEQDAQAFLDNFRAQRQNVESEPAVYRNTEIAGDGFDAFVLTSLLPGADFNVHIAKMKD